MQEEQIAQRTKILSTIMIVIILVGFTGYSFVFNRSGETNARITFHSEGYLTILDSTGASLSVFYKDISGLAWEDSPDYGEAAEGTSTDSLLEGHWRNTWGDYTASIDLSIPACILIETTEGKYAINWESKEVTQSLFQSLEKVSVQHE